MCVGRDGRRCGTMIVSFMLGFVFGGMFGMMTMSLIVVGGSDDEA